MMRLVGLFVLAVGSHASLLDWIKKEVDVHAYNADTSRWIKTSRAPSDKVLTLTVAMRVEAAARTELERLFWEVSDPKSEKYGAYRNLDEITQILAVPKESVQVVRQHFLTAGAISAESAPTGDMITVVTPVHAAEVALNTTLHTFVHSEHEKVTIIRAATHYALPGGVAERVNMVGELLQFPRLPSKKLRGLVGSASWPNSCTAPGCGGLVTPSVLSQRYKLPTQDSSTSGGKANSMAVAEFQGQYYEDSDLKQFSESCHADVKVAANVGGNQQSAGVESELDIEYIKSVAPEVPLTVVYSDEYSLLNWVNQITSMANPIFVHSVSYGNDELQQSSTQYMETCNTAFMKAGLRGISILFASGDQGVCGRSGCGFLTHARFHPDFPAASPYITAVGGTDFATKGVIGEETAWSSGGGGFSDTFGIPDYQKQAVAGYLASSDANFPPQNLWNRTGRGYPDVAALGGQKNPYCVATGGRFGGVAGTSASCPVVAGVFARLNGLRLAAGKPPMGFLNPFIYQNPSGFQDVTSGTNGATRKYGFTAVKGWDAATGMGTPDYAALAKLSMSVQSSKEIVV